MPWQKKQHATAAKQQLGLQVESHSCLTATNVSLQISTFKMFKSRLEYHIHARLKANLSYKQYRAMEANSTLCAKLLPPPTSVV